MVITAPSLVSKPNFRDPRAWPGIYAATRCAPPEDPLALATWIHLQPVTTPHTRQLDLAQSRLRVQHLGHTQRWLAVNGDSDLGKSTAITSIMLREAMTDPEEWLSRRKDGSLFVPFVYVEIEGEERARGLMSAIAHFCGIPDTANARLLRSALDANLPRLGTRLIVIDDGGMLRRSTASASTLTDGLRTLLRLPVPVVFVGIRLENSALLWDPGRNNDTVQQLRRRHIALDLTRLQGSTGVSDANAIIAAFGKRLHKIPDFSAPALQDKPLLSELVVRSEGRPGTLLSHLKTAAAFAALSDRVLSVDLLADNLPPPVIPENGT